MRDPMAPVIPVGVEIDPENIIINTRGEFRHAAMVYFSEDDIGRMRAGYVCAKCYEPHPTPFPEACLVCKFPMKDKQSELLARDYKGNVRLGPQTNADTELAAMEEWQYQNQARQRDEITRPSQILLPGKDF